MICMFNYVCMYTHVTFGCLAVPTDAISGKPE